MIATFMMVLLIGVDPYPAYVHIKEFPTLKACQEGIKQQDAPPDVMMRLSCLALAHETI